MTKKQKYIARCELGAQALEENKLKSRKTMFDADTGGRCCLCVLLDVAVANGYKGKRFMPRISGVKTGRKEAYQPHRDMIKWYGLAGTPRMEDMESYIDENDVIVYNNHSRIGADFRTQHTR